jgi:ATP-dependent 26S proteasome regulatory subunit
MRDDEEPLPLVYVELQCATSEEPQLSAALAKLQLIHWTVGSSLLINRSKEIVSVFIRWDTSCDESLCRGWLFHANNPGQMDLPLLFRQQDPLQVNPVPCACIAYAYRSNPNALHARVLVNEATIVRVRSKHTLLARLTGEAEEPRLDATLEAEVRHNQNKETIQELSLRMKILLSAPLAIGTTRDALVKSKRHYERRMRLKSALRRDNIDSIAAKNNSTSNLPSLLRDVFIIVHSPNHGSGKTLVVQTIAYQHCHVVHVVRPGALLAKYGTQADAALEAVLHEVLLSAAIRKQSICIILDQFNAMMPPCGDAASPVVNGIASYLKTLTTSIYRRREIPFPIKSPLYNLEGKHGWTLSVKLCLVAITTSPDNAWRKSSQVSSLQAGRYRLPPLTAQTRLTAFQYALAQESVQASEDLDCQLPFLAASATWVRGALFRQIARVLSDRIRIRHDAHASPNDLIQALQFISGQGSRSSKSEIEFLASDTLDTFAGVGGNKEAKLALEDSIFINAHKHGVLTTFGLRPPASLLLYGLPGTGKTLLAKAVAKMLRSEKGSAGSIGGAFVSLKTSEIVGSEVGGAEKLVVEAFQTARMNAPAVVFIDEFQALFTDRSRGGSSRLTSTLLQCMDDLNKWREIEAQSSEQTQRVTQDRVMVLAATNTPWMIDKAFIRPGRLDRTVHVGLPDIDERSIILDIYIGEMKTALARTSREYVSMLEQLACMTEGFSGADLVSLCRSAAVQCLLKEEDLVSLQHFSEAMEERVYASSNADFALRIDSWRP